MIPAQSPFHFPGLKRRFLAGLILLAAPLAGMAQGAPGWLMLRSEVADSVLVTDPGEKGKLEKDGWKLDGEVRFLMPTDTGALPLHRMARPGDKGTDRMLSTNAEEVSACIKDGFADEGMLGYVAATQLTPEMVPVYRYRKEKKNLWLIDKADQPWAEKNGWKLDGAAFWARPAPAKPAGA
jgi:hypothetical protein